MARIVVNRSQLESMLLGYLRASPRCKEAGRVVIASVRQRENGANWTVVEINAGRATPEHCDQAMQFIVPMVQKHFDLEPDGSTGTGHP